MLGVCCICKNNISVDYNIGQYLLGWATQFEIQTLSVKAIKNVETLRGTALLPKN